MGLLRSACVLCIAILLVGPAIHHSNGQNAKFYGKDLRWSDPPTLDGIMLDSEWLPSNDPDVNGYDNVIYIYDKGILDPPKSIGSLDKYGFDSTGGLAEGYQAGIVYDPPVIESACKKSPAFPTGFNLFGLGAQWHPDGHGSADYYFVFDLPGSSNLKISEDRFNPHNGKYAIAFDADANEDASSIDTDDSILPNPGYVDLSDTERYTIFIWLGPTTTKEFSESPFEYGYGSKTLTDGLPLELEVRSIDGSDSSIETKLRVIGKIGPIDYTVDGHDIDFKQLVSCGESIPSIPSQNKFDIEVSLKNIKEILDSDDINWIAVKATDGDKPLTINQCANLFLTSTSGTTWDLSAEDNFEAGIFHLPLLPFDVDVEKYVGCGDCGHPPAVSSDKGYTIPDAKVRFEMEFTVPVSPSTSIPNPPSANGSGWIVGKDKLTDNHNAVESYGLCEDEITVNGVADLVSIPGFNVLDQQWVVKTKDGSSNYEFNPGDVLYVPFEVKVKEGYSTHNVVDEIKNRIEVWGENADYTPGPNNPYESDIGEAVVDVLVPELHCEKAVQVIDDNGKKWDTLDSSVTPPEFLAQLIIDEDENIQFPIDVIWYLNVSNSNGNEFDPGGEEGETFLLLYSIIDPVLTQIGWPGVALPITLAPGDHEYFLFTKHYPDWNSWYMDAGGEYEIPNTFEAKAHVIEEDPRPAIGFICVKKDYPDVYASTYYKECDSSVLLGIYPPPAAVAVKKEVSCNQNGPWYESVDALPSQPSLGHLNEIWFRITIVNIKPGVPIDHASVTDTCTGPIDLQTLPPSGDIGPIPAEDGIPGGPDTKVYKFYGYVKEITASGKEKDIVNVVLVEADGPDPGVEPDNGPYSSAMDEAWANVRIPGLELAKSVYVQDSGTWNTGTHLSDIYLPNDIVWPLTVKYKVQARIPTSIPVIDGLDVTHAELFDDLLEEINNIIAGTATYDPKKPPITFTVDYGADWIGVLAECKFKIADKNEFILIAKKDEYPQTELIIENKSHADYDDFEVPDGKSSNDLCGEWEGQADDWARIIFPDGIKVPALSTYGMIILSLILGGLIFLRIRR